MSYFNRFRNLETIEKNVPNIGENYEGPAIYGLLLTTSGSQHILQYLPGSPDEWSENLLREVSREIKCTITAIDENSNGIYVGGVSFGRTTKFPNFYDVSSGLELKIKEEGDPRFYSGIDTISEWGNDLIIGGTEKTLTDSKKRQLIDREKLEEEGILKIYTVFNYDGKWYMDVNVNSQQNNRIYEFDPSKGEIKGKVFDFHNRSLYENTVLPLSEGKFLNTTYDRFLAINNEKIDGTEGKGGGYTSAEIVGNTPSLTKVVACGSDFLPISIFEIDTELLVADGKDIIEGKGRTLKLVTHEDNHNWIMKNSEKVNSS